MEEDSYDAIAALKCEKRLGLTPFSPRKWSVVWVISSATEKTHIGSKNSLFLCEGYGTYVLIITSSVIAAGLKRLTF